jgi:hypothetical protein
MRGENKKNRPRPSVPEFAAMRWDPRPSPPTRVGRGDEVSRNAFRLQARCGDGAVGQVRATSPIAGTRDTADLDAES